jgi:hypothetical protein
MKITQENKAKVGGGQYDNSTCQREMKIEDLSLKFDISVLFYNRLFHV